MAKTSPRNSTYVNPSERLCSRLSPLPSGVPFGLRSVGQITLPPGGATPERVTDFVHVVWGTRGTGAAHIDGVNLVFPPQCTAAFPPGVTHCLCAGPEAWSYRWITLDGPGAALVVSALGLGSRPTFSGACPDALFDALEQAVLAIDADGERRATVPAYKLLVSAACGRGAPGPRPRWTRWAENIRRLLEANMDDPAIGITQIAEIAGLDRTTFSYRFRKACGVSPKEYVTALRLQRAVFLLRTTENTVAEIASQCGFTSSNYFIRAFGKRIGTTPLRYRRQGV